ncbi:MAG: leucine-rich repeat domain-containing protein [Lachnospiraceae bacterium]|nr:leucine-rich repeat domain-containing protein [Lachnospiraceae bacterium]
MNTRRTMKININLILLALSVLLITGCTKTKGQQAAENLWVVLREDKGYIAKENVLECKMGKEVSFEVETVPGVTVKGCDYDGEYEIDEDESAGDGYVHRYFIKLKDIQRIETISLLTERESKTICYDNGEKAEVPLFHRGINTLRADQCDYNGDGTLLGFKTDKGKFVTCGSRIDKTDGDKLKTIFKKWTKEDLFITEKSGDGCKITGVKKSLFDDLIIPGEIGGRKVYALESEAFSNIKADKIVLPTGLLKVSDRAFQGAKINLLYINDDVRDFSPRAFEGARVGRLKVIAATAPVYSGNYFDGFADKLEALKAVSDEKKIVLFSGSSARFGYDSRAIEEAFPGYKVINMGVFAYTNALYQLRLIREQMMEGDILVLSPEFDASQSQFCIANNLEWHVFAMTEGNYSLLDDLDLSEYEGVWQAFSTYLTEKRSMEKRDYNMSVFEYDEDGKEADSPVYNGAGDYVLFRPNASDNTPIYDLPVLYAKEGFPENTYIKPFNKMCREFLNRGIRVYFTYAPRNRAALSKESTKEKINELDKYLRDELVIPVISDINDSLFEGRYLYGTDNHLSTEGVKIRTKKLIKDLGRELS